MPLGTTYWACILPVGKQNLIQGAVSYERGTIGAGAIQGATLGSTSQFQAFGAWSLSVTPTSNGTSGAYVGTATAGNGTAYSYSAYVRGAAGVGYMLAVADTSNALIGSVPFTGGGTWQRYVGSYTENSGANRRVLVRKNGDASTGAYYVDGVQFEAGSITTYLDGDQEGCAWDGAPHNSTSTRDGQSRAGGSVVALADLGFTVNESPGIGMPPLITTAQSYALLDGAQFQRQRADTRAFTLTSTLAGTTYPDLHVTRRKVIDAFKIDAVAEQQPVRFWYVGGPGTVQIDAVLDGGLDFARRSGFTEDVGVRFLAHDPFWYDTVQDGTALAANSNLGSVYRLAYRDPIGQWGTLGANGTTVNNRVYALLSARDGTVYLAGDFGSVAGTAAASIAMYVPATNRFGTLGAGIKQAGGVGFPFDLAEAPNGDIYCGFPTTSGGTGTVDGTVAHNIAFWRPSSQRWGTLAAGGVRLGNVHAVIVSPTGTLYVGGGFGSAGGTVARGAAQYDPTTDTWGTMGSALNSQSAGNYILDMAIGLDGKMYAAGSYGSIGGTANANHIAFWEPVLAQWGTMTGGVQAGGGAVPQVNNVIAPDDGRIYIGGRFGSAGGGTAENIAQWNGVSFSRLANGLTTSLIAIQAMLLQPGGRFLFGGAFYQIGSIPVSNTRLGEWLGAAFVPGDILFSTTSPLVYSIIQTPSGTVYIANDSIGTANAASVAPIVNTGMAIAYPTLVLRNTGSGTARVYQLLNTTTGARIYFDLSLIANEEATLTLAPGDRSFHSNLRGNIVRTIIPGSNLALWSLLPGTNYVSFLADSSNLQTSLFWRNRHWSADGGATP